MGWKNIQITEFAKRAVSQSAFAGYGLEEMRAYLHRYLLAGRNPLSLDMGWKVPGRWREKGYDVAIRFRWIWVGSFKTELFLEFIYGVAIRFRWIWVGSYNIIFCKFAY